MGADLNNIVKCQKLTDDHVQFLIYQILRGLKVQAVLVMILRYEILSFSLLYLGLKKKTYGKFRALTKSPVTIIV